MAKCAGLWVVLVLATIRPAAAHDGPHLAHVITDVISVQANGRDVVISLRIEALQDPVTLAAVSAGFATPLAAPADTRIVPGAPVQHVVHLRFSDDVPSLFTLMLDFGDAGLGTVLIVVK